MKIHQGVVLAIDTILKGIDRRVPCDKEVSMLVDGCKITIVIHLDGHERWLDITHEKEGIAINNYQVYITGRPSNLGLSRGLNLYMFCPVSGVTCKHLHLMPGTNCFKHRSAYDEHIYYPCEALSHKDRLLYSLNYLDKHLIPLVKEKAKLKTYNGKETRLQDRLLNLNIRAIKKENQWVNIVYNQFQSKLGNEINSNRKMMSTF